ncbi:MAG TPA: serine hydrolase [Rhizomicrobium sp.]|nr:serine hydrolase [Rhizomicrobium sp.]
MSKGFARKEYVAAQFAWAVAALAALIPAAAQGQDFRIRHAAGQMAPTEVALAVLPPAATVADMQAHDADGSWPTRGWGTTTPEAQGIDSTVLTDAMETIRARHIPVHSLLIERHGKIVLDAYFAPFADNQLHDVFSVTKSVTSTLVGIAMRERRISDLRTPVAAFLPDSPAAYDPVKRRLTLSHMLSMTSGLACAGNRGGNFLQAMEQSPHWTDFALSREEVGQPGSTFTYCAGNMQVVSAVLTRSLGEPAADYAQSELFGPLGITHVSWAKDRDGNSHGFSDLRMQPRDMAKLGYLWLHRGAWEGRQIVPAEYLDAAFSPHANVQPGVQYGYGMWIYPERGHAGGPPDFEANGVGGQRIAVVPSQDMVMVITGAGLDANNVASLISGAVRSDTALPSNTLAIARLNTRVAEAAGRSETRLASARTPRHSGGVVRTAALSPP